MMLVTAQLVDLEHTLSFHLPILEAIEQRSGDRAASLMTAHMKDATELLTTAMAQQRTMQLRTKLATQKRPLTRKTPANATPKRLTRSR